MKNVFCPECGLQASSYTIICNRCSYPIGNRINGTLLNPISFTQNPTYYNKVNVNNTIVWLIAIAPIFQSFFQGFVYGFVNSLSYNRNYSFGTFFWVAFIINSVLCYWDINKLKESGIDTSKIKNDYWLVPVYLYKRAKLLNQELSYFIVWIVTFILSIIL